MPVYPVFRPCIYRSNLKENDWEAVQFHQFEVKEDYYLTKKKEKGSLENASNYWKIKLHNYTPILASAISEEIP